MDVIITVIDTGEVLDIFPKFALENKITSAFFNTEGSRAMPVTFPMTDRNTRIFGQADRLDRKNKTNNKLAVIVRKGSYSRKAHLYFNSSNSNEFSYSASIAYDEAVFYELQSKLKLTQLPNLPVTMKPTDELIKDCNKWLTEDNIDEPLTVFQIYLKNLGTYKTKWHEGTEHEREITNELSFAVNEWKKDHYRDIVELIVKDSVKVLKDDQPKSIKALRGIGISPFVRGWYIINKIAEHFGYQVGDNPFRTEPQLRRLVFLNNTADAIVADYLDYKQLMPDVTITDFFQFLWARFGANIFIDGNTNTLHIRLLKDSINQKDAKRLPISGKYAYDEATPKQIKLSAGKNLDSSGTETDTYEEFCTKYNNTIGSYIPDISKKGLGGILYDASRGLFFHAAMEPEVNDNGVPIDEGIKSISSIHFDWDKKDEGLEYVEISSPDECITAHWREDEGLFPYYGLDFALLNSVMELERDIQDRNEPNRLAVCWDMGQYYYGNGMDKREEQGYKFGSIFPYLPAFGGGRYFYRDREGNKFQYALTWVGKNGCFEHFWKDYDAILRHSHHQVKGKLDLLPFDLASINISEKFIVGNHPILLTEYNYITGNVNVDKQEFVGVTVGLYEPNNLKEEQAHPAPEPIKYKWGLQDTKQQVLVDEEAKITKSYKDRESATFKFISFEWTKIEYPDPPSMSGLWYLPPTEDDFLKQTERGHADHEMYATYKVKYSHFVISTEIGEGSGSYWKDEEVIQRLTLPYKSYFIPIHKDAN